MRSGVSSALQQTLTSEAASVLKHSLGLARRRGHAQVTPLHVAATLLSLRSSSFRRACLKSQPLQSSHPLQCRALELCFNVALNRLPTTTPPSPLIHTSQPTLSNALIAALKRAQAHQRRGCIEQQQQQPLLTIKVELEQLVVSILDDPSVSRVMREAGFSSTAVKNHIEEYSSSSSPSLSPPSVFYNSSGVGGGVFSSPCSPSASENHGSFKQTHFLSPYTSEFNPLLHFSVSPPKRYQYQYHCPASYDKDDVNLVLDVLLRKNNNKKKNCVIVGDSLSLTEGLVGEIMRRVERSEVPEELKSIHFVKFQFERVSLRYMKRDEVEVKILELKRKVDSVALGGGGGIFYVGDLKWTVEDGEVVSGYNPVDHLVSEIGKLFSDCGTSSGKKVWLMATASYQTYMRCQMRQPPLEIQWSLQAVPVPSGGLGLTLHASSVFDSKMNNLSHMLETKPFSNKEQQDMLSCCEECASNYEKEAQLLRSGHKKTLPFWLQSHTTEGHNKDDLSELKRKWNRLCQCLHQSKQPLNQWNCSNSFNSNGNMMLYPYNSSTSISFTNNNDPKPTYSNLVPRFRRQQSCTIEFDFNHKRQSTETFSDSVESSKEGNKEVKITLALGNGGGSGETAENNRTLQRAHVCKILQDNVPWQSETIPSLAEALVDSKSAITWLILQGNDSIGKRRFALSVAESVFGSVDEFLLHFDMLKKETLTTPFSEKLIEALKTRQQLVVLIENVDFANAQFKKLLSDGFETGKFGTLSNRQVIFILTNGGSSSTEGQNHQDSVFRLFWQVSETKSNSEESCFGHKRKAELDLISNIKSPRIEEKKDFLVSKEEVQETKKKDFSRNSSFNNNTLDLNMKADEFDDDTENTSPISSDLTRESTIDPLKNESFLDSIEKKFEFNTSPSRDREMAEEFLSKIKGSFEEVCGKQNMVKLSVDEKVIEELSSGCGSFTNSMFEKWLKDIFQSSLGTVNFGGKEGILCFRLCWGGKGDDSGFMSSSLPRNIHVNYFIE